MRWNKLESALVVVALVIIVLTYMLPKPAHALTVEDCVFYGNMAGAFQSDMNAGVSPAALHSQINQHTTGATNQSLHNMLDVMVKVGPTTPEIAAKIVFKSCLKQAGTGV